VELWQGPLGEFVGDAEAGAIAGEMAGRFVTLHGSLPSPGEVRSWEFSLRALADALHDLRRRDVGVAVAGALATTATGRPTGAAIAAERSAPTIGIATEYHLPLSGKRIDVLLCGRDGLGGARALVVELKQWSDVTLEDEEATNVIVGGYELAHPCQQALDYAEWLQEYHSAFTAGDTTAFPLAYCHGLAAPGAARLRDGRFQTLLERSPLFVEGDADALSRHVAEGVGSGGGAGVLQDVTGGRFEPSKGVLETLEGVLLRDEQWHLLDTQRVAHDAVLAELRRLAARKGRSVVIVRGGPGTGKSVIAVQLLADALRLGLRAAHSTGGKAFTTALRSKFKRADRLFLWNMNLRNQKPESLDLLLIDEAHRVRTTSDILYTPKTKRTGKPQVEELIEAAKVSVFLLDENQYVRPDEIGTSDLVREAARRERARLREYDLAGQFRCGGCEEYIAWVDGLLGFGPVSPASWGSRYSFRLADNPEALTELLANAQGAGERARLVAGFCWKWSDSLGDGRLVPDVRVGEWAMPWNRKRDSKKRYRPDNDPYTLWAETDEGYGQVGCIYSAQGFEFDRVGVIWGPDLVWRSGAWVAQPASSHDLPVKRSGEAMLGLVRNAYRILLTRGAKETMLLCLDDETRRHVEQSSAAPS
jgi:hypothetical protein